MKMPRLGKGDRIEVVWEDIVSDSSWQSDDAAAKAETCTCHTIGYYVNHDKRVLRIATSYNAEKQCSVDVIPRGCITSVSKLERAKRCQ